MDFCIIYRLDSESRSMYNSITSILTQSIDSFNIKILVPKQKSKGQISFLKHILENDEKSQIELLEYDKLTYSSLIRNIIITNPSRYILFLNNTVILPYRTLEYINRTIEEFDYDLIALDYINILDEKINIGDIYNIEKIREAELEKQRLREIKKINAFLDEDSITPVFSNNNNIKSSYINNILKKIRRNKKTISNIEYVSTNIKENIQHADKEYILELMPSLNLTDFNLVFNSKYLFNNLKNFTKYNSSELIEYMASLNIKSMTTTAYALIYKYDTKTQSLALKSNIRHKNTKHQGNESLQNFKKDKNGEKTKDLEDEASSINLNDLKKLANAENIEDTFNEVSKESQNTKQNINNKENKEAYSRQDILNIIDTHLSYTTYIKSIDEYMKQVSTDNYKNYNITEYLILKDFIYNQFLFDFLIKDSIILNSEIDDFSLDSRSDLNKYNLLIEKEILRKKYYYLINKFPEFKKNKYFKKQDLKKSKEKSEKSLSKSLEYIDRYLLSDKKANRNKRIKTNKRAYKKANKNIKTNKISNLLSNIKKGFRKFTEKIKNISKNIFVGFKSITEKIIKNTFNFIQNIPKHMNKIIKKAKSRFFKVRKPIMLLSEGNKLEENMGDKKAKNSKDSKESKKNNDNVNSMQTKENKDSLKVKIRNKNRKTKENKSSKNKKNIEKGTKLEKQYNAKDDTVSSSDKDIDIEKEKDKIKEEKTEIDINQINELINIVKIDKEKESIK